VFHKTIPENAPFNNDQADLVKSFFDVITTKNVSDSLYNKSPVIPCSDIIDAARGISSSPPVVIKRFVVQ